MLEPYIWYDPHEVIKKLEFKIFSLKFRRQIEADNVDKILKSASAEISFQQNSRMWQFDD